MNCPYCGLELVHVDSYGKYPDKQRIGEIYKCPSADYIVSEEDQCYSSVFDFYFHTWRPDSIELVEGYPC